MSTRLLEVRQGVLSRNDRDAAALRTRFAAHGLYVVNLVSSPGAGKTALLEVTLRTLLARGYRVAALVGDLETENDANRLARSGAPVRQIQTGGNCHLEAETIERFLADWNLAEIDFLFIENVGNLVCPANYDLGENLRAVLLSTTEGEDKPLKYPPIFYSADIAVLTKIDLAEAVEFDRELALANLQRVHPGLPVVETSAKRGSGMDAWLDLLATKRDELLAEESRALSMIG